MEKPTWHITDRAMDDPAVGGLREWFRELSKKATAFSTAWVPLFVNPRTPGDLGLPPEVCLSAAKWIAAFGVEDSEMIPCPDAEESLDKLNDFIRAVIAFDHIWISYLCGKVKVRREGKQFLYGLTPKGKRGWRRLHVGRPTRRSVKEDKSNDDR